MGRAVCMSSATLVVPWSVCRVRSGAKVPVKAWWLRPGGGCRCRRQGLHAAQWLLVDEQFPEEFPKCFGGWVESAPQCHLGLGMQQCTCAGEVAFIVIGVQQAGRRPAVDVGGQFPGKVDRVEHAGIECYAGGGEQMGRIADQQDPPVAVPLRLPSLKLEAREPNRFSQG